MKQKKALPKPKNPVAKFAAIFNKCSQMKDKKKAFKRGESKYRPEDILAYIYL